MQEVTRMCTKCGRTKAATEFYTSKNLEKYPDGRLNECKSCATLLVDNWDEETFKPLLEELDLPYVRGEWIAILKKLLEYPEKINGMSVLGRYISKMKLKQWKDYRWKDSERLEQADAEKRIEALLRQGFPPREARKFAAQAVQFPPTPEATDKDGNPLYPVDIDEGVLERMKENDTSMNEDEQILRRMTEEDVIYLQSKWGRSYHPSEWVRLEQLYNDMINSYDIQGAGSRDYLIMICKASLKANQLIDMNDVEGFQKMSKVYDSLMKSSKLTAAQTQNESSDCVNAFGELVELAEKEGGFIPRFYVDTPNDKIDYVLQDLKNYTRKLVTEETNLGNLIENAVKMILADKSKENSNADDFSALEKELFMEEKEDSAKDELNDAIEFMDYKQEMAKLENEREAREAQNATSRHS